MPLIWMLLCILTGAAFGHIMRHAQLGQRNIPWVGAWNYLFAALASWVWLSLGGGGGLGWDAAVLGTLSGLSFVAAFFAMNRAIQLAGVGVTLSVQWLGVTLPVVASILFWREIPTALQAAGLVLAFVALPLLASGPGPATVPHSRWKALFLTGLFLLEGGVGLALKVYCERVPAGSELPFLCFMFSGAATGSLLIAWRLAPPHWRDLTHGAAMGASNIACNFTFLRALTLLPGTVAFPTISVGSIAVAAILGWILWQERYDIRSLSGLSLAALALVAINI